MTAEQLCRSCKENVLRHCTDSAAHNSVVMSGAACPLKHHAFKRPAPPAAPQETGRGLMPRGRRVPTVIANDGRCLDHKPLTLGYVAWHEEAERRGKRGMKQRRCHDCAPPRWYWHDEWGAHGGWDAAEREPAATGAETGGGT